MTTMMKLWPPKKSKTIIKHDTDENGCVCLPLFSDETGYAASLAMKCDE